MELIEELDRWIQVYSGYRTLRETVNTIKNGKEYWFTCVLHPEIEPTNNLAETMLSLFSTWKLRKLQPYAQLKSLLGA